MCSDTDSPALGKQRAKSTVRACWSNPACYTTSEGPSSDVKSHLYVATSQCHKHTITGLSRIVFLKCYREHRGIKRLGLTDDKVYRPWVKYPLTRSSCWIFRKHQAHRLAYPHPTPHHSALHHCSSEHFPPLPCGLAMICITFPL